MSHKVCEYLRWLKESGNYTHQRLSDLTEIPYGTIPKYFSGLEDESASFEIVRKLVMAMGGSLDELAGIRPKSVETNSNKTTEDGFTESEIKVILRWANNQIIHNYQRIITGLEARLSEKDERLSTLNTLLENEHNRILEEIAVERKRAAEEIQRERKRAHVSKIISYTILGMFALLFVVNFFLSSRS